MIKHKQHALIAIVGVLASMFARGCAGRTAANEQAREIMDGVFDAIAYLLPLSVRASGVSSEWDRELIDSKLAVLRSSSAALVAHSDDRLPEFALLARSFDETVREIDTAFKEEWPSYAFFSLMDLTQHCVACHSQEPANAPTEFGQRLLARVNTHKFDPTELAELYVATRQFDSALRTFEQKLLSPNEDAVELDFAGIPVEYLAIALGVAAAPERADRLLDQFGRRSDLPYYLQQRVAHWRERLAALRPKWAARPTIEAARQLFNVATKSLRSGRDRTAASDDLVVTSILRRFIAAQPSASGPEVAEAYYMLGIIWLRTREPKYSVPELEVLFVSAIKSDAGGPFAKQSYLLLEELGYVRDVPLARAEKSSKLIDMAALRRMSDARR